MTDAELMRFLRISDEAAVTVCLIQDTLYAAERAATSWDTEEASRHLNGFFQAQKKLADLMATIGLDA